MGKCLFRTTCTAFDCARLLVLVAIALVNKNVNLAVYMNMCIIFCGLVILCILYIYIFLLYNILWVFPTGGLLYMQYSIMKIPTGGSYFEIIPTGGSFFEFIPNWSLFSGRKDIFAFLSLSHVRSAKAHVVK